MKSISKVKSKSILKTKNKSISKSTSKVKSKSKSTFEMIPPLPSDYNKSLSVFRNMMVLYYQEEVLKEIQKGTSAKMLRNHEIYQNQILKQNAFVFCLYNKLPIEFLPHPEYLIYSYPIITFYNHPSGKIYSYGEIQLQNKKYHTNERIISEMVEKRFKPSGKYLKVIQGFIDSLVQTKYTQPPLNRDFQIHIPTQYIKSYFNKNNLNHDISLCIYVNNTYMITNQFSIQDNHIEIKEYIYKMDLNAKYQKSTNQINIKYTDIQYLSVNKILTKEMLLNVFHLSKIDKGTHLYHLVEKSYFKNNPNCFKKDDSRFFTLYPGYRIFDPFYFKKYMKFITGVFLLKEDLHILNITYTIMEKNSILGNLEDREDINYTNITLQKRVKRELFTCSGLEYNKKNKERIECGVNILNKIESPNYQISSLILNRFKINLLINKTKRYIDSKYWYDVYLKKFGIKGIYNNLSMYHDKDGYKSIYTELHILDGLKEKIEFIKLLDS